ncbi:MAG TPA: YdcF family protein [Pyrinomonadaceae bacterium]|nr:YdcF family protein [Pyrinomonadaceae bacterium]
MKLPRLHTSRRSKPTRIVLILSLCALLLLAWGAATVLVVEAPLEHADAIAVLSGSAVIRERAQFAAQLYKEGRAPKIILTNDNHQGSWSSAEQRNPFYYEQAADLLAGAGVPRAAIEILPQPVSGTDEEASLLRRYAEEHQLKSILVVTSAYHSRRALWTLRQVFANTGITVGLIAVPPGNQAPSPATWWLHIRGWQMVAGEYAKMVYYRLR